MLSINPKIPRHIDSPFIAIPQKPKKIYMTLSVLMYFLKTVNPNNSFSLRLKGLFDKYPNVDVAAMGFPMEWQSELLWR
jgi:abortive infection bacteriophage resistance protein